MKTLHKVVIVFSVTLAEFLDSDELNRYSFGDDTGESLVSDPIYARPLALNRQRGFAPQGRTKNLQPFG